MWRYYPVLATLIVGFNITWAASVDIRTYQLPFSNQDGKDNLKQEIIRCYCNQPECVPQGYMCRGSNGCFTKLPSHNTSSLVRPEHSVHNGCLVEREQCPPGLICCSQDLCNHVDSPAVISRLNKTLRILLIGQQELESNQEDILQSNGQSSIQIIKSDNDPGFWIRTTTVTIAICGIIVLLVLASFAIRLLQPAFPMETMDKRLGTHTISENTPPLLELRKAPFV